MTIDVSKFLFIPYRENLLIEFSQGSTILQPCADLFEPDVPVYPLCGI